MASTYKNNIIFLSLLLFFAICIIKCSNNRSKPTIPDTHPENWMISSSIDFHANVVLNGGSVSCKQCHGLDFNGGRVGVSCIACHAERTDVCTGCHGGLIDNSGAPPYGLRGEISDTTRAVGAHTAHLNSSGISGVLNCSDCHDVPAFTFDSNHFDSISPTGPIITDSIAEISWSSISDGGSASWDRNNEKCSGVYCHGAFDGGNQDNIPIWNMSNQADCGSCHDVGSSPANLKWKHEYHLITAELDCYDCHAAVVDSDLSIIIPNLHVNGSTDILIADSSKCIICHVDGVLICTGCHGGLDNNSGAPPYGLEDETASTQLAVGAHTSHLDGNGLSDGISCSQCHTVPTGLADVGHLGADNIAELNWGQLAGGSSLWNRTTEVCSNTYCHGNFDGGNSSNGPQWTGSNQADCGSCHDIGVNPENLSGMHKKHITDENVACQRCHNLTQGQGNTIVGLQYHIDGEKTISFSFSANYSNGTCSGLPNGCHGTKNWYDN